MEYLQSGGSILLALLGFGLVIFIHELGHFICAKLAGVRVDVFSIGFPPTLWAKRLGETRYAIGMLPFGGYVKMLGQDDVPGKGDADPDDPRSYSNKHPLWRALILLGGVTSNLLSAYLLLLLLCWSGMPHVPPHVTDYADQVATVVDGEARRVDSPAKRLGLRPGDEIRAVNGEPVYSFEDISLGVIVGGDAPVRLKIRRDDRELTLPADGEEPVTPAYDAGQGRPVLGLIPPRSREIYSLSANTEDIEPGWTIEAVDGRSLAGGFATDVQRALLPHVGGTVSVTFSGPEGAKRERSIRYAGSTFSWAFFGLPLQIRDVTDGRPAALAGVQAGDVVCSIDGNAIDSHEHLVALTQAAGRDGRELKICLARYHRERSEPWEWVRLAVAPQWSERLQRWLLGIETDGYTIGPLPHLPADLGPTPLQAAGVPADAMLFDANLTATAAVPDGEGEDGGEDTSLPLQRLLVISGGRHETVTISAAGRRALVAGDDPLLADLVGHRVVSTAPQHLGYPEPGHIQLEKTDDKQLDPLNLNPVPEDDRLALLSLEKGDWILGLARQGDMYHLHVVRGSDNKPQRITVGWEDRGILMRWGPTAAIRPYPLGTWTEAFSLANHFSEQMIFKTLMIIPRFFVSGEEGGLDPDKSLSGPLGIFFTLKESTQQQGFKYFLKLLALISLNLFLINLLPIPITDGGQLLFLGIESAIRRPLPVKVQNIAAIIGIALVAMLMLYTLRIDIGSHLW